MTAFPTVSAFNARASFNWQWDRLYRVYVQDKMLYFIRIGGQGGMDQAIALQFGLLGGLALSAYRSATKRKQEQRLTVQDQQNRDDLLAEHKHNFRVASLQGVESSIEPPGPRTMNGPHYGLWILNLPDNKMTLRFESPEEMQKALELLPAVFGNRLGINVVWNERKKRYTKP